MSVWVTLLSFAVSMTWGIVRVSSVGGVCGWVFMNPTGREGECSEATHPTDPHTHKAYELTPRMVPRW